MNSDLQKKMVVICGVVAIATVAVVIGQHERPFQPLHHLQVQIDNGVFSVPSQDSNAATADADSLPTVTAYVAANQPVFVTFNSNDFVYVIEQRELKQSIVIMPRGSTTMELNVPRGEWPIGIMQGCGRMFAEHDQTLLLHATTSR